MGIKEEAVGEAINLGSGKEHRVIDMANMVNELTGQTLRKLDHQTFKKGLIQKRCASCTEAGIKYVERRDLDVKHRLLSSIEKAKRLLDYQPKMEFGDGLKHVHDQTFRKSLIKIEDWENIKRSAEF
jgi:UDP-glucose 4-epimerase